MRRPPAPPRLAERWLAACLPAGTVGRSIVGDAREEFAQWCRDGHPFPRARYWIHALAIAGPYLGDTLMDTVVKDLRRGIRSLARQPGSAVISVLILALGIGLSTFMFSLVYGVFFRSLDVPDPHRLVVLQSIQTESGDEVGVSSADYLDFREQSRSFDGLAGYYGGTVNLADDDEPVRLQGLWVTANAFDVLGLQPALGRGFVEGEDAPDSSPAVILGHGVWRDRYDGDPGVLGSLVRVNGRQGTVVGVMPEGFRWPSNHDVWITMDDDPHNEVRREGRFYQVMGRLAEGVDRDRAGADVARLAARFEAEHPDENEGLTARLVTVSESQNGDELAVLFTAMMVAVLFVLLVACANVANLLLARAATRMREAGVRVALGAGRTRVIVPFLAESLVLAAAGALLGTGLAYVAVHLFDQATATPLTGRPYFMEFKVDLPVLLWVVGVTGFTALVAGIAPALQVSRADVNTILKDESRGSSSLHMGRLSRALVTVEVALSVALLVGAGLMTRSMVQLARYELPYDTEGMLTARVGLVQVDYPTREDRQRFFEEAERRMLALPGVSGVALANTVPGTNSSGTFIRLEGREYPEPSDRPRSHVDYVTPGFFAFLGESLLEGEGFTDAHDADAPPVAIVNRSFVEEFWPDGSAVGRRFRGGVADSVPWITVVGVVDDLNMQGFQPTGSPSSAPYGFYRPLRQMDPAFLTFLVRASSGAPETLAPDLRRVVREIDPNLPLYDVQTADRAVWEASWFYSVFGSVFVVFGLAALFMASVGLYGVLSFSVSRRTQEMGIRMALGAGGREVRSLILRQGALQVVVGLLIGLVLAWGVSRVVGILMYQVDPRDPLVFAGVVAVIVAVGVAASLVPALRATRVDPMVALRSE